MNSPDLPAGLAAPFTLPYRPVLERKYFMIMLLVCSVEAVLHCVDRLIEDADIVPLVSVGRSDTGLT